MLPKLADICTVAPNKSACLFLSFFFFDLRASQHRCLYLRFLFLLIRQVQCSAVSRGNWHLATCANNFAKATALVVNEKQLQLA